MGATNTETNGSAGQNGVRELDVLDIRRSPFNRKVSGKALPQEFVDSIKEHGIIQPLIVRASTWSSRGSIDPGSFELVAGERRYWAAVRVGLKTAPAIVRELDDTEAIEFQAIENLQREDLSPIEEAEKYQQLIDQYKAEKMTVEQAVKRLGERVGKGKATIFQALALLKLPAAAKEACGSGKLPASHAGLLYQLQAWPEAQGAVLAKVVKPSRRDETGENGTLSFRAAKSLVEGTVRENQRRDRWLAEAETAKAKGLKILSDEECKKLFPYGSHLYSDDTYVSKDTWCSAADDYFGKLMGKHAPDPVLAHTKDFETTVRLYPKEAALAAVKANGHKVDRSRSAQSRGSREAAKARAAAAATRRKTALRRAVVSAVVEKAGNEFTHRPDTLAFAKFLLEAMKTRALSDTIREMFNRRGLNRKDYKTKNYGPGPHHVWFERQVSQVTDERQAIVLIVDLAIAMDLSGWGARGDRLLQSACSLFGVNAKKIEAKQSEKPDKPAKKAKSIRLEAAIKRRKPMSPAVKAKMRKVLLARWAARKGKAKEGA